MPNWLKDAVFYEIYPQSFKDTTGDGIGDFNGIIEKLDYVRELGCNALWINPCFDSPFKDAGYDVRDYKKVAPRYGTMFYLILSQVTHLKNMNGSKRAKKLLKTNIQIAMSGLITGFRE